MQKILLLHGALGSEKQLDQLKNSLVNDFEVHSLSFYGHGGSESTTDFSIVGFANQVNDYLIEKSIDKITVFGYSMGGYVALYLAKEYPEKIDKIITLATKFYWTESIAKKEISFLDPNIILSKLPHYEEQLKNTHYPVDWKLVLSKTADLLKNLGSDNPLQLSDYLTIEQPVLCIIGKLDQTVTIEETVDVCRALPNGSLLLLPNAKHAIEKINVQDFCKHVIEFVN